MKMCRLMVASEVLLVGSGMFLAGIGTNEHRSPWFGYVGLVLLLAAPVARLWRVNTTARARLNWRQRVAASRGEASEDVDDAG